MYQLALACASSMADGMVGRISRIARFAQVSAENWRRERDSNPRAGLMNQQVIDAEGGRVLLTPLASPDLPVDLPVRSKSNSVAPSSSSLSAPSRSGIQRKDNQ